MSNELAKQDSVNFISAIERAACNPDIDISKMQALLDMQERIMNKNAESAFNAAMAAMQSELPVVTKDAAITVNKVVRSRYASFEAINEVVKPIMQKHGFAIIFKTDTTNHEVKVTGILVHEKGHREQTEMVLPVDASGSKNPVQAVGSSVQYGKRYVMSALLNITTAEDDDATGTIERITEEQQATLSALLDEVGANYHAFLKYMQAESLDKIRADQYDKAVSALEAKRKAS